MFRLQNQTQHDVFETLESIIKDKIPTAFKVQYPLNPEIQTHFVAEVHLAIKIAKEKIADMAVHLEGHALTEFIRFYQRRAGMLAGALLGHTRPPSRAWGGPAAAIDILCADLFEALEAMLLHLRRRFPAQFNDEEVMPDGYTALAAMRMQSVLAEIDEGLNGLSLHRTLIDLVCAPLQACVSPAPGAEMSFQHLFYLETLAAKLTAFLRAPGLYPEKRLQKLLHEIDFNSRAYIDYCTDQIRYSTRRRSLPHRPRKLALFKAAIIQASRGDADRLYARQERLVDALLKWINAELDLVRSLRRAQPKPATVPPADVKPAATSGQRKNKPIPVDLAVPDVGLGVWLLKKNNVILKYTLTKLFCIVGKSFSTIGAEKPSEHSISKYYYDHESSSVDKLYAICLEMLADLEKLGAQKPKKK